MAHAKGTTINTLQEFARSRFGESGWSRLTGFLSQEDQKTLRSVIAAGWYDFDLVVRLMRALHDMGKDDNALLRAYGRYDAEHDLKKVHRLFLRMANPAYVLEKAGEYWSRFFDRGRWEVQRNESGATGTLTDMPITDEIFCTYLVSYIGRMFELVGARDVSVKHARCMSKGHNACVFEAAWR